MAATVFEMEADFWAYYYDENGGKDEIEDEDFDLDEVVARMNENPDDWEPV